METEKAKGVSEQMEEMRKKYEENFNWSEIDEFDEDKMILLNEFKADYNEVHGDLEEGMISNSHKRLAPPPKMTAGDREIAKSQPIRHKQNKRFSESIFGQFQMCCGCRCVDNHDLNKRENKYYNRFAKGMIEDYDSSNSVHEYNL